jgi:hypothetical protein
MPEKPWPAKNGAASLSANRPLSAARRPGILVYVQNQTAHDAGLLGLAEVPQRDARVLHPAC